MGKRIDIHSILIIGAGPIIIGQACEFDYAGSQACKALREEGYQIILVNSNPATIMTDPAMAHKTYIEPLTVESLEKIIAKEKPDAILPTLGGQTGLNLAIALYNKGVLAKYNVEMLGADAAVIQKAEDRAIFKQVMDDIGLTSAKSYTAYNLEEAQKIAEKIGYPCVVRPAFTLGGTGGGIAYSQKTLDNIVQEGLQNSLIQSVLIEESLIGWKEYELEVIRDKKDNVVIVCTIENLDPMGIHTGDSITVAPAQTLTDREYQAMRNAALAIIRAIGVETGGANVQFAIHPKDGRMVVIEMNPRVSRSSALASKATGFPIAKIAAKLAVGYTLPELKNDITQKTTACFEPTIDYIVVKIPRFNFDKFSSVSPYLGTAMRSVGEVMAIGRTFKEALQKGFRSLEIKRFGLGFDGYQSEKKISNDLLIEYLIQPNPIRLLYVQQAFLHGMDLMKIYHYTKIDPWFLYQIQQIVDVATCIQDTESSIREAKKMGFSDTQLAYLLGYINEVAFRKRRISLGIIPVYKLVDTCAGEFEAYTPYYYSTYEQVDEVKVSNNPKKIMILGSGPNRIGQGIEFDYCCVHAALAAHDAGYETIMVNTNPETVSTDFDSSDKLYFEPLTLEDVLNIYEKEQPQGVIIQFGGQTPLNLAAMLQQEGVNILGTAPEQINNAEDRKQFSQILQQLQLNAPAYKTINHVNEAHQNAHQLGYPIVVRPSYVLGGAAMQICYDDHTLQAYIQQAKNISPDYPILIDQYLDHAIEVDVDALSDGNDCIIAGILEHIEPAGIHSGDSACVFPTYSLSKAVIKNIKATTLSLAKKLQVVGLLNIQFAIKEEKVYIIEVNPRASRTVPFISKATGISWAQLATQIILGKSIASLHIKSIIPPYFSIKEASFPFNKFSIDPIRQLEMRSTGEVMGIDTNFYLAFYKAQLAVGNVLPLKKNSIVCFSIQKNQIENYTSLIPIYQELGFQILLTTQINSTFQNCTQVAIQDFQEILDKISKNKLSLLVSQPGIIPSKNEVLLRKAAIVHNIPLITSYIGAQLAAKAIKAQKKYGVSIKALQNYYCDLPSNKV